MRMSPKLFDIARSAADSQELVEKCQGVGVDMSLEKAQKLIDAVEFTEIDEESFDIVAGGYGQTAQTGIVTGGSWPFGSTDNKQEIVYCSKCQQSEYVVASANNVGKSSEYYCTFCNYTFYVRRLSCG